MKRLSGKLTYANVASTLCLVLLVGGGTAYAASEMLPKNSVGTKQIMKEAVTPAKLSKASKTTLTGPTGATGATGPQGPAGPEGDAGLKGEEGEKGDTGAPAISLWAQVGSSGSLGPRQRGAIGAVKGAPGQYEVVFDQDISKCAYLGGMSSSNGEIEVELRSTNHDAVYVETYSSAGAAADKDFTVAVLC